MIEQAGKKSEGFEVWEENREALEIFLRVQTQWVFAGMGSIAGLNYQSLEFVLKLYRPKDRRELFEKVQEIERGVLETLAKEGKK